MISDNLTMGFKISVHSILIGAWAWFAVTYWPLFLLVQLYGGIFCAGFCFALTLVGYSDDKSEMYIFRVLHLALYFGGTWVSLGLIFLFDWLYRKYF